MDRSFIFLFFSDPFGIDHHLNFIFHHNNFGILERFFFLPARNMIGIFNNFVKFFIAFPNEFRPFEKSLYYGLVIEKVFVSTCSKYIINNVCENHRKIDFMVAIGRTTDLSIR